MLLALTPLPTWASTALPFSPMSVLLRRGIRHTMQQTSEGKRFTDMNYDWLLGGYGAVADLSTFDVSEDVIDLYSYAIFMVKRDIEEYDQSFNEGIKVKGILVNGWSPFLRSISRHSSPFAGRLAGALSRWTLEWIKAYARRVMQEKVRGKHRDHDEVTERVKPSQRSLKLKNEGF